MAMLDDFNSEGFSFGLSKGRFLVNKSALSQCRDFPLHYRCEYTWPTTPSCGKKRRRGVKSCESVNVVTINDRERKWRCEIQFKDISSTQ